MNEAETPFIICLHVVQEGNIPPALLLNVRNTRLRKALTHSAADRKPMKIAMGKYVYDFHR
jgi:hypothetical protein